VSRECIKCAVISTLFDFIQDVVEDMIQNEPEELEEAHPFRC
jgi:hypothetical protein